MVKNLILFVVLFVFSFNSVVYAQQGKTDVLFNTIDDGKYGDGFDNVVRTLSLQTDQKLIVGGEYLSLNGIASPYLTRLNSDGSIDETFNIGTGFNGKVYTSYIQPDGKIIVGGSFTSFQGYNTGRLVRLNTNGTYDTTFRTAVAASTGIIYDICPQTDGRIIIVGSFTRYDNVTVNRVARVWSDGSLDTSFATGSGSSTNITNVKVLSDGKVLLTGNFTSFNGIAVNKMVRLSATGAVDLDFNKGTGFDGDVNALAVQSDGKILLGGKFTNYDGTAANRIIRLNTDGTIDAGFLMGSGFNRDGVQVIQVDFLGNIMVGGSFTGLYDGAVVNRVCLLNQNGILDKDFDMGSGPASGFVYTLVKNAEGFWYIGGSFSVFDSLNQGRLAKINANGEHDPGYLSAGVGFNNSVLEVLPLKNKNTLVLGNFTKFNGNLSSRITRILEDGSYDATFNSGQGGANNSIKTAVLQADSKVVFGGNFTKYNEAISNRIARIFSDGTLDNTFSTGSGCNGQVYSIALQPDEKIVIAGNFTSFNGLPAGRIMRLLPNGLRDSDFNIGTGADAIIESVLLQPDGKILVGGRFNRFDGYSSPRLIRLNADGSIDLGFKTGSGFDKIVYTLGLQSDQKIIAGGSFLSYNGIGAKRIVRLHTDGSPDLSFESGTGFSKGDVRNILIQPDDRILAGGTFSGTYKTHSCSRLIRLKQSGDYDAVFQAELNGNLYTMKLTSDHKLIIGGDFNSVSGVSKHRIAQLKLCINSTIWEGGTWSNGLLSEGKEVFFKDDFLKLTSANICNCAIDAGKQVVLLSENTLGVEFLYEGPGVLTLEDSASFYQSDDAITNTGIVHVKRKSTPILKLDYTYWSSPVTHQKLIEVSPDTLPERFYSYDYNLKNWRREDPSGSMAVAKGYIIRGPEHFSKTIPSRYEATFIGVPNNGKVEINLGADSSFNLIGNPYPSALDADAFLTGNKDGIMGSLYFWTHNTPAKATVANQYTSDDYAVYNLLGGVGTSGALAPGINESIPDGTIASAQAFFVISKGGKSVEFEDSMRIRGRNSSFFKIERNSEKKLHKNAIEKHRLWLNFRNPEGVFKQILVGYIQGATNLYDSDFDAESINGNKFANFYSIVEDKKLVIQGRGLPFVQNDSISLGYQSGIAGKFSFDIEDQDGFFDGMNVFIEDKNLRLRHNLKDGPYHFSTQEGSFNERFVLRFIDTLLPINDFAYTKSEVMVSVKDKILTITSMRNLINEISIFDILGKELCTRKGIDNLEFQWSNFISEGQVLFVKVKLENGQTITRKTFR